MSDTHELMLCSDFLSGDCAAECSCGWTGPDRTADADAVDDWENHCDVVFMEATGG